MPSLPTASGGNYWSRDLDQYGVRGVVINLVVGDHVVKNWPASPGGSAVRRHQVLRIFIVTIIVIII